MAPPPIPIQLAPPHPPFSTSPLHNLQLQQNPITSTDDNTNTNIGGGSDRVAIVQFPGSGGGGGGSSSPQTTTPTTNRKGRGRPKGSKNKPKPQTFVAVDGVDLLHSHFMEISPGSNIPATLVNYARRHLCGLSVLNATGAVLNPSFCNLTPPHGEARAVLPIAGTFEILSFTGTILPSGPSQTNYFTMYLGGPNGQIVGGTVAGPLVAAGTVSIMAATFSNAMFEKLPREIGEEEDDGGSGNSGRDLRNMGDRDGSGGGGIQQQQQEQEQLIGQEGFGWKGAYQHHHRQQLQQHQQQQSIAPAQGRPLYM